MILKRYKLKSRKSKGSYDVVTSKTLRSLKRLLAKAKKDLYIWLYYAGFPTYKELLKYMKRGFFIHKYDDPIRQIKYIASLQRAIKKELSKLR